MNYHKPEPMTASDSCVLINNKRCYDLERINFKVVRGDLYPVQGVMVFDAQSLGGIHPLHVYPDLMKVFDMTGAMYNEFGDVISWVMGDCRIIEHEESITFCDDLRKDRRDEPALQVSLRFEAKEYTPPYNWGPPQKEHRMDLLDLLENIDHVKY